MKLQFPINSSQNGFILYQTKQICCKIDAFGKQIQRGNQIKRLYVFELNHVGWRKKITIVDTQHDIGNNYDLSPVSCMDKRLFNDCEGIFYP